MTAQQINQHQKPIETPSPKGTELSVKQTSIQSLQAYRGLAALLVLLFHGNAILGAYFGQTAFTRFFQFGHAGVDFFFVLSGFIMMLVHHKDLGKPSKVRLFLTKRFLRIYPLYWIVTFLFLPIWFLIPSFGEEYHREIAPLIMSLLLLPQDHFPHVAVGWSLIHEVLFYLLFAVAIWNKRIGMRLIMTWMVLITVVAVLKIQEPIYPFGMLFSQYNILFLIGMVSYWAWVRLKEHQVLSIRLFILGNLLFIFFGLLENLYHNDVDVPVLFGLASAAIILGSRSTRIESFFRRLRPLCFLGDSSYSVYLIHYFALSVACKIVDRLPYNAADHLLITYLGICLFALLVGIVFYVLVERQLIVFFKKRALAQGKTSA